MKVQIVDKKATFQVSASLTARQLLWLKDLDNAAQAMYLLSLNGMKSKIKVRRTISQKPDALASKSGKSVLGMAAQLMDVNEDFRPLTPGLRWLGVEIECFFPAERGEACGDCDDCSDDRPDECGNAQSPSWSDMKRRLSRSLATRGATRVSIKEDGSLSDDTGVAMELTVMFPQDDFSNLQKVCDVIKEHGGYVNATCGLHVHLDCRHMSDRERYRYAAKLGASLPVLTRMVPQSRLNNQYCRIGVSKGNDRYYAINKTAISKFGTIEVRLHAGTIMYSKISQWCQLLLAIGKMRGSHAVRDFASFTRRVDLVPELLAYVVSRCEQFSPGFAVPALEASLSAVAADWGAAYLATNADASHLVSSLPSLEVEAEMRRVALLAVLTAYARHAVCRHEIAITAARSAAASVWPHNGDFLDHIAEAVVHEAIRQQRVA